MPPGRRFGRREDRRAVLVGHGRRNQCVALRQQQALHQGVGAIQKHESRLTAVSVGGVVFPGQSDLVAGTTAASADVGSRAAPVFGIDRLDTCKADLAAILQSKGACIDHRGDAALALRLKRASGGDHRTGGGDNKHEAAQQDRRATSTTKQS